MEREATSMQVLCRGGCGFYGSSATDGLCSVCFKEALKKKRQQPNSSSGTRISLLTTIEENSPLPCEVVGSKRKSGSEYLEKEEAKNAKLKIRCSKCQKKVGLTGVECRCGGVYCGAHRYSDEHSCTFDYRALGAEEIRRNNPVVIGEKVRKI